MIGVVDKCGSAKRCESELCLDSTRRFFLIALNISNAAMERIGVRAATLLTAALLIGAFGHVANADLIPVEGGRCPSLKTWGVCPEDAPPCDDGGACAAGLRCCETQCGDMCVKPVHTGCENVRMAADRRARALGVSSVRAPRCDSRGAFDPVQCDNELVSACWCVDEAGFELPGTRAPARALVNCSEPASCAAHTCRMLCPYGFELSKDGCPLCRCRDPCATVRCPDTLKCQLEEMPCLQEPCPPVPTCKKGRSLDNICPVGEPLLISDTHRPFLCGTDPGKPNCPPLYQCLVEKGNDYGVCCPASLKLEKPGSCPAGDQPGLQSVEDHTCGIPCGHDLECPSMQKCCDHADCGKHCSMPVNVTVCLQQKMLAELLVIHEREGRGYVPQCSEADGRFLLRQCSRNSLVCWCVDPEGNKIRGSMGPAQAVNCTQYNITEARAASSGRSLSGHACDQNICASVCEYGYRIAEDGCPTCQCDDPCSGYTCAQHEECIRVKDEACAADGMLCASYPVCRPKVTYVNPCQHDTPYTNDTTGDIINCDSQKASDESGCPTTHRCTAIPHTQQMVCCPNKDYDLVKAGMCPSDANHICGMNLTVSCVADVECKGDSKCCETDNCGSVCVEPIKGHLQEEEDFDRTPTMCEYLRDFDEKMEGTHDGMKLALPRPACHDNGSFVETQCGDVGGDGGAEVSRECWCVDNFGTEIPRTRGAKAPLTDCIKIRTDIECLDLTCRLGCDYGFMLEEDSQCPSCQCRNPCHGVACGHGRECQLVDVACDGDYCPPVPACLPRKVGQCPYLVPRLAGSCEFECHSDVNCNGTQRCCTNGCGTQCVEPLLKTACQHQQAIALHGAAEAGVPARQVWVAACDAAGDYERVQCHAARAQCWCVNRAGHELPGTRGPADRTPHCRESSSSMSCSSLECTEQCTHGHVLDEHGCATCACRDPCQDLTCSGENELCTLVKVECTSEPCPPVAMCLPAPGAPCGESGAPLLSSSGRPLMCGPVEHACPSSHACQMSPLLDPAGDAQAAFCCPKPRSVCFEPRDEGACVNSSLGRPDATRWHFNPDRNKCEKFVYGGCSGNHNNFQTEQICNSVCPVLSQCERLREKNQKAATRYRKSTFAPACDPHSGKWQTVQCMPDIGVCWCVNARGEPLKGSLVRGARPDCNYRQARRLPGTARAGHGSDADEVLEELIKQMTAYHFISASDSDDDLETLSTEQSELVLRVKEHQERKEGGEQAVIGGEGEEEGTGDTEELPLHTDEVMTLPSRCHIMQAKLEDTSSSPRYRVSCERSGAFSPRQCDASAQCWCVDEAGNQLPGTRAFREGEQDCVETTISSIDVKLVFPGAPADVERRMEEQLRDALLSWGAHLRQGRVELHSDEHALYMRFTVLGPNKVDVAYHMEQLMKEGKMFLDSRRPDVTRSTFRHIAAPPTAAPTTPPSAHQQLHREVVSDSTVSVVTPYHTALIVLAAASAFVISVMSVLIMLYRKKVARLGEGSGEGGGGGGAKGGAGERFLSYSPPIYVLSTSEKAQLAEAMRINEPVPTDTRPI